MQECLAFRRCYQQGIVVRTTAAVVWTVPSTTASKIVLAQLQIQRVERHRPRQLVVRQISRSHAHYHPGGSVHIVPLGVALVRPSLR